MPFSTTVVGSSTDFVGQLKAGQYININGVLQSGYDKYELTLGIALWALRHEVAEHLGEHQNLYTGERYLLTAWDGGASYSASVEIDINKGALISSVDRNSPASKAGLKAQDILLSIDGEPTNWATNTFAGRL